MLAWKIGGVVLPVITRVTGDACLLVFFFVITVIIKGRV